LKKLAFAFEHSSDPRDAFFHLRFVLVREVK